MSVIGECTGLPILNNGLPQGTVLRPTKYYMHLDRTNQLLSVDVKEDSVIHQPLITRTMKQLESYYIYMNNT